MDKSLDEHCLMKKPLWLRSRDHPKQKKQKKEHLAFMINRMSKRISLLKQTLQSCEANSQKDTTRWDVSLSPVLHCLRDKNDPDLCQQLGKASLLCESDKNNTEVPHCGLRPEQVCFSWPGGSLSDRAGPPANTHQGGTFQASIFAPLFSCFDRKQEMIT